MMIKERLTRHQAGVGLIEVLVSLLVLSVGFLVSANMQLRGMRSNQDSYYQTQALMLANEMMDRMRNNRDGDYSNMTTNGAVTKPACASSGCSGDELAKLDRYEWSAYLRNLRDDDTFVPMLPPAKDDSPASGNISSPSAEGVYTLTMKWMRQDSSGETLETMSFNFIP